MQRSTGMAILIAEDNPLNFELVSDLLESRGHSVVWARDGAQAVAALEASRPVSGYDVLLLDVHLPVLDGVEVARRVQAVELECRPRVIALTADSCDAMRCALLEAGAEAFLAKPMDLEAVVRAVEAG
ncbi:MAG TPA: response regulator [Candidatus Dormibacteraeota bacterium]